MQCFSAEQSWHNDMLLVETFLVILSEVLLLLLLIFFFLTEVQLENSYPQKTGSLIE